MGKKQKLQCEIMRLILAIGHIMGLSRGIKLCYNHKKELKFEEGE